MKCSIHGCNSEAIFHDEVPEPAKRMGIRAAGFCSEHKQASGKLSKLHEALALRKKNIDVEE